MIHHGDTEARRITSWLSPRIRPMMTDSRPKRRKAQQLGAELVAGVVSVRLPGWGRTFSEISPCLRVSVVNSDSMPTCEMHTQFHHSFTVEETVPC